MGSASRLAVDGGVPVRDTPFASYSGIGPEERRAVLEVLDTGNLSQYVGTAGPDFLGGPRVRALEEQWAAYFGSRHAVAMNSATSGLYAAIAASGVGPGDEVIVSPYTMSASAVGALVYGATPVFADIDPRTYCISEATIAAVLTERTKAIVAVDLFGHAADLDPIRDLARTRGLVVIEDAAQAPGARYHGRSAGTLGDMGIFSLNYHKMIHAGEGGVVVTDDARLAERLQLIRNHAEAVVKDKGVTDLRNLIGFNYRLTEIQAAIGTEQLHKLEGFIGERIENSDFLRRRWANVPGLEPAWVQEDCRHVYYVLAVQIDPQVLGVSRSTFVRAVRAEGVPLVEGYVEPLYLQPIYQQRAFSGGPNDPRYRGSVSYDKGICPVAERMHEERLFYTTLIHPGMSRRDLEDVAVAVEKVAANVARLSASRSA